jgi:metal-responsive CopG/Arc/MetJ family transcriptional regulator
MANIKTAISIQGSLFKEIETMAHKMHVSRSYLVTMAAKDFLQRQQNKQLLQRLNDIYGNTPNLDERKHRKNVRARHRRLVEGEW